MYFKNLCSSFNIRKRKLDFSIYSTWSNKSRIKCIRSICSHNHFNLTSTIKSIKLIYNFHHCSLDFVTSIAVISVFSYCIYFIKKYNWGFLCFCILKYFSHYSSPFTNIFLNQFAWITFYKSCICSISNSSSS